MSQYDDKLIDSDLDAFKNSGAIQTASLNFGGSVGAGSEMVRTAQLVLPSIDFYQILFDSSTKHSGKFKSMQIGPYTLVHESTRDSELGVDLTVIVTGNIITIRGSLFNPYDTSVNLDSTTLNFRYIPYEATI
jgi:hypothetical protein